MTLERLQEIRDHEKDSTIFWNILTAQQDRRELLEYIEELEARCEGKVCIDPKQVEAHLQNRPARRDPFLVEPLPQGALPIYDKSIDVVDAVVGEGEEP